MSGQGVVQETAVEDGSVVDQILTAFLSKVEAEPGLADAAVRLRKTLLEDREDSEIQLKAALFEVGAA